MTDKPAPKNKGGRPKKPPTPPALGIADRSGPGYKFSMVIGGLVVNGKKFDPQTAADLLASMLADALASVSAPPAPLADYGDAVRNSTVETAMVDPSTPELAVAPGENGSH